MGVLCQMQENMGAGVSNSPISNNLTHSEDIMIFISSFHSKFLLLILCSGKHRRSCLHSVKLSSHCGVYHPWSLFHISSVIWKKCKNNYVFLVYLGWNDLQLKGMAGVIFSLLCPYIIYYPKTLKHYFFFIYMQW